MGSSRGNHGVWQFQQGLLDSKPTNATPEVTTGIFSLTFPFYSSLPPPSLSKGGETPWQTAESPEGEGSKLQRFSSSLFPTQIFINMGVEAPAGDNMLKTYCFQCLTLSIHGLLQIITPGEDHMFSRAVFSTYFSEGNDYTGVVPLRLSQSMPLSH